MDGDASSTARPRQGAALAAASQPAPGGRERRGQRGEATTPTQRAIGKALLDSRNRWRDLVSLSADLAFETDAGGVLTFVAPDLALGWTAAELLGQEASRLLSLDLSLEGADPLPWPARNLRVWANRGDGSRCRLSLSVVLLHDDAGNPIGLRGAARDVTNEALDAETAAAALRRSAAFNHLLRQVRGEAALEQMAIRALEGLLPALGCAGAALLDMVPRRPVPTHRAGEDPGHLLRVVAQRTQARAAPDAAAAPGPLDSDMFDTDRAGHPFALLRHPPDAARRSALLTWRAPGSRGWDTEERELLQAVAELLRAILCAEARQRALEQAARIDALTGLSNRGAFIAELAERVPRRTRQEGPAALFFMDLDHFKPLNDMAGHQAGDAALRRLAVLLRSKVRSYDLVARFGGDEFVLWLEGMGGAVAEQRAQTLLRALAREAIAAEGGPLLSMSIGIALHHGGSGESPDALLARADAAMYAAKRGGGGAWRLDEPRLRGAGP